MFVVAQTYDTRLVRWSYEQLVLRQSQVRIDGLWQAGARYYILCPDLSETLRADDGRPLIEWFNNDGRAITSPVEIVAQLPAGAVRVPERTPEERTTLVGAPLTVRDASAVLCMELPKSFPDFAFETSPPIAMVHVERSLDHAEEDALKRVVERHFGSALAVRVIVDPAKVKGRGSFRSDRDGDIHLVPSRRLPHSVSARLREAVEADEDYWTTERGNVLGRVSMESRKFLPTAFVPDGSCCLVDTQIELPSNLRSYLCIYRRVAILLPLADRIDATLAAFRVSETDLVELAKRGRLQVILPQSVDRYPLALLDRIAESAPSSLLMSRRLAAATVVETRRRIPLLVPPFDVSEQRRLLEMLLPTGRDPILDRISLALRRELPAIWATVDYLTNFEGAMAMTSVGVGRMLADIVQCITRRTVLELYLRGASVQWAATLGATLMLPEEERSRAATTVCASAYSGVPNTKVPASIGEVETVLNGLRVLDNDAPVIEVAEAFDGRDVERLEAIARGVTSKDVSADELASRIVAMNNRVAKYEKSLDSSARRDVLGLLGALAPSLLPEQTGFLPIGLWLVDQLLSKAHLGSGVGQQILDWLRGVNTWTTADVVLLSRLRK